MAEFLFSIGNKVSIAFNKMPDDEKERLENAVSPGYLSKTSRKSSVFQSQHQTVAQTGTILEQRIGESGAAYLVNVDIENLPRGRQRAIIEDDLTIIE